MRDFPVRILMERLEELVLSQQKFMGLVLSEREIRLPLGTALEMLYGHIEMLELSWEIINALEDILDDYTREHALELVAESLSWINFMLPYIEVFSPIFVEHILVEGESISSRLRATASLMESLGKELEVFSFEEIAKTIETILKAIRYQLYMAKRSYDAMA